MSTPVPSMFEMPKSIHTASTPSSPAPTSRAALTPRSTPKPSSAATSVKQNLSSFAPWDRDQFVARLASFKNVFWSELPREVCELEWARRGWVERRDGKTSVMCGLCRANLEIIWHWDRLRESVLQSRESQEEEKTNGGESNGISESPHAESASPSEPTLSANGEDIYSMQASDDTEASELLLRHYKPLLSSGHMAKCPWRSRSTDLTVLRLPPQLLSLPSLISRVTTLTSITTLLPQAERIVAPKPLPSDLPTSFQDYDPRVLQAGITGWSGSTLGSRGILVCTACHRRVALWLFTADTSESQNGLRLDEESLDLLAEHKWYCPWTNGAVQTGMAGWEYMYSLVEPRSSSKRSAEDDRIVKESRFKQLREMLKNVKR